MRTAIFVLVPALVFATCSFAQQTSIYDHQYSGPTNYYGQPTFEAAPNQGRQEMQQGNQGLIPMAVNQLQGFGSYLWSYMPAPLRGAPDPNTQLQQGYTTIIFVPGSR